MKINRKEFLLSSVGMFALYGSLSRNNDLTELFAAKTLTGTRMSMLYDSSKCLGCKMCEDRCSRKNDLGQVSIPGEMQGNCFMSIQSFKNENGRSLFFKKQCFHCTNASCVSVCPTGAAEHKGEYVVIDQDVCIGCGYCEESCPFSVPHREPEKAAHKCMFCLDKIQQGKEPVCVNTCPNNASTFGPRDDLMMAAKQRVDTLSRTGYPDAQLYGEEQLGGLNVIYVLQKPPAFYGLPENPREATKNLLTQWLTGSLTAAVLVIPFWYFYKRMVKKDKKPAEEKKEKTG